MDKIYLDSIKKIQRAIQDDKLCLFVGAGISVNSGAPSYKKIIKSFAEDLGYKEKDDFSQDEYSKIPQYYFNEKVEDEYLKKLKDIFKNIDNLKQNEIHKFIFNSLKPKYIITTNYDNLLEKEAPKYYDIVKENEDIPNIHSKNVIIKMHGDFSKNNIVLKEDDYSSYSKNFTLIETYIKAIVASHTVLFIGYSVNDINVKMIFKSIKDILGEKTKKAYLLNIDTLSTEEIKEIKDNYYKNQNIIRISYTKMENEIEDFFQKDDIIKKELEKNKESLKGEIEKACKDYDKEKVEYIEGIGISTYKALFFIKSFYNDKMVIYEYYRKLRVLKKLNYIDIFTIEDLLNNDDNEEHNISFDYKTKDDKSRPLLSGILSKSQKFNILIDWIRKSLLYLQEKSFLDIDKDDITKDFEKVFLEYLREDTKLKNEIFKDDDFDKIEEKKKKNIVKNFKKENKNKVYILTFRRILSLLAKNDIFVFKYGYDDNHVIDKIDLFKFSKFLKPKIEIDEFFEKLYNFDYVGLKSLVENKKYKPKNDINVFYKAYYYFLQIDYDNTFKELEKISNEFKEKDYFIYSIAEIYIANMESCFEYIDYYQDFINSNIHGLQFNNKEQLKLQAKASGKDPTIFDKKIIDIEVFNNFKEYCELKKYKEAISEIRDIYKKYEKDYYFHENFVESIENLLKKKEEQEKRDYIKPWIDRIEKIDRKKILNDDKFREYKKFLKNYFYIDNNKNKMRKLINLFNDNDDLISLKIIKFKINILYKVYTHNFFMFFLNFRNFSYYFNICIYTYLEHLLETLKKYNRNAENKIHFDFGTFTEKRGKKLGISFIYPILYIIIGYLYPEKFLDLLQKYKIYNFEMEEKDKKELINKFENLCISMEKLNSNSNSNYHLISELSDVFLNFITLFSIIDFSEKENSKIIDNLCKLESKLVLNLSGLNSPNICDHINNYIYRQTYKNKNNINCENIDKYLKYLIKIILETKNINNCDYNSFALIIESISAHYKKNGYIPNLDKEEESIFNFLSSEIEIDKKIFLLENIYPLFPYFSERLKVYIKELCENSSWFIENLQAFIKKLKELNGVIFPVFDIYFYIVSCLDLECEPREDIEEEIIKYIKILTEKVERGFLEYEEKLYTFYTRISFLILGNKVKKKDIKQSNTEYSTLFDFILDIKNFNLNDSAENFKFSNKRDFDINDFINIMSKNESFSKKLKKIIKGNQKVKEKIQNIFFKYFKEGDTYNNNFNFYNYDKCIEIYKKLFN